MGARHTDADLFHQWEEAEDRAEKWEQTCREERRQHKAEIADLRAEFREEMAGLRSEFMDRVNRTETENRKLKAENQALKEDNERLKSIINNDSNNSSLPPSSDQKPGKRKANEYNGRDRSGKKRGGQPGHKGKALKKETAEALISSGQVKHEVIDLGEKSNAYITKYEIDIETAVVVREYRYHAEAAEKKPRIPEKHHSDVSYGNGIKGMAAMLYSVGVLSNERMLDFINGITNNVLRISAGGMYKFIQQFAARIDPRIRQLKEDLLNAPVLCTDATGISVNGTQQHIRNISTADSVVYIGMDKKNLQNLKRTPLGRFMGTLVHDHETALFHFGTAHAECNVHILRYLTKNSEDTGNKWSEAMKKWLCDMNKARKRRIADGQSFTEDELAAMEEQYTTLLRQGQAENEATKPKWAKKEEASLLRRLEKYRDSHLLFLRRFDIPFDNNLSERDLRKIKNRQKMSGGFRDESGRDMFCSILSFIETCKRRSLPVFQSICAALHDDALFGW